MHVELDVMMKSSSAANEQINAESPVCVFFEVFLVSHCEQGVIRYDAMRLLASSRKMGEIVRCLG